jgi:MSHA biogenesis protein MshK
VARWWFMLILPCCVAQAALDTLQDPTLPLTGTASGNRAQHVEKLPRLQGLILGRGPQRAILDGESYRLGERVAGYRLVNIRRDGVVLERDGQRHSLPLYSSKVKIQ